MKNEIFIGVVVISVVTSIVCTYFYREIETNILEEEKNRVYKELNETIVEGQTIGSEYEDLNEEYDFLNISFNDLKNTKDKYHLHDPTLTEVTNFIDRDKTDKNTYTYNYVCVNYASEVDSNAESQGIRCGVMYFFYDVYDSINFTEVGYGHAINVFDTTDHGRIFVDNDDEIYYSQYEIENDYGQLFDVTIAW